MPSRQPPVPRRHLLKLGLFGASSLAVLSGSTLANRALAQDRDTQRVSRYRETAHVRRFYQVNQYPREAPNADQAK